MGLVKHCRSWRKTLTGLEEATSVPGLRQKEQSSNLGLVKHTESSKSMGLGIQIPNSFLKICILSRASNISEPWFPFYKQETQKLPSQPISRLPGKRIQVINCVPWLLEGSGHALPPGWLSLPCWKPHRLPGLGWDDRTDCFALPGCCSIFPFGITSGYHKPRSFMGPETRQ